MHGNFKYSTRSQGARVRKTTEQEIAPDPEELVGAKILSLWPDDCIWYPAVVRKFDRYRQQFLVEYQDTSEEWIALHGSERGLMWRLESEQPLDTELSNATCELCAGSRVCATVDGLGELVSVKVNKIKRVTAVSKLKLVLSSSCVRTRDVTARDTTPTLAPPQRP